MAKICDCITFLNTGTPEGYVFSPLLYSLFTHKCFALYSSNTNFKFAVINSILGFIIGGDKTA